MSTRRVCGGTRRWPRRDGISPYNLVYALCHAWSGDWAMRGRDRHGRCFGRRKRYWPSRASRASHCSRRLEHHARLVSGAMGQAAEGIPLILQGMAICRATAYQLAVAILSHDARGGLRNGGAAGRRAQSARRGRQVMVETTQERWAEAEMIGCGGRCCCPCMSTPQRRIAIAERSRWRAAERQVLGTPRRHRPRPPLARPRQAHRSPRSARTRLRLVHRRVRHAA